MAIIDNKGNWEFNFYQKKYEPVKEANIKQSMVYDNGFNPKNVNMYINNIIPKEETILIKKKNGKKLNKSEEIILNNYLIKNETILQNDLKNIEKYSINAQLNTVEGKIYLLFKLLQDQLSLTDYKKDNIANIYFKLNELGYNKEIYDKYTTIIDKMNEIIKDVDLIKLQFTKNHMYMPPLNINGFKKLDEWQIQVIKNIDNKISTVVNAPTSAGKSILSGYTITKGNILYVVPTDALAWQISSYIGNILNVNVPIITQTYQTIPTRDDMINLLNNSKAIVGTPNTIVDFLPFTKNNFEWIIFDEIHMIGKEEGYAMEYIIKLLPDVKFLALSATISNSHELVNWFRKISTQQIDEIICNKRFFNLQKYYYSNENDEIISLHPLSLITEEQLINKSLINKTFHPTPIDCWDLALKLKDIFDLDSLDPYNYFNNINRINLDNVNEYFYKLINLLVDKYSSNKDEIINIINSYKHDNIKTDNIDLIKLIYKIKNSKRTPAILFHKDTNICLNIIRDIARKIEIMENEKYPKLYQERLKKIKENEKLKKKLETKSIKIVKKESGLEKSENEKDKYKNPQNFKEENEISEINLISLQEPHEDFIFTNYQNFNYTMVEEWNNNLKKYFPNEDGNYHYIIKLLWRGIGVYVVGLPEPYLRLVQILACKKQLGFVFSDMSLVFGINMPFKTVIILNDDELNTMLFHQMIGRAGRRGLDKEGNVIFAGFNWDRIKELSICQTPEVIGIYKPIYTLPHANQLSILTNTNYNWYNIYKNFLNDSVIDSDNDLFIDNIKSNFENSWNFALSMEDINHLHMNWKLRYNNDCIVISFIIPYLIKAFNNMDHNDENSQIIVAHFLSRFICIYEPDSIENILLEPDILNKPPYNTIITQLQKLEIHISNLVDNQIFVSIKHNKPINSYLINRLQDFSEKIKIIQHYFYHSKIITLCKILGKLLTRLGWIAHLSLPILKPLKEY
jgi:superfamily II RNA helicase